jgi:hypothetical protein
VKHNGVKGERGERPRRIGGVACLLVLFLPSAALAEDRTVSPGDDLAGALAQAQPGDTIRLSPGEYPVDDLRTPRAGRPDAPITLIGEEGVVLKRSGGSRALDVQHAHFRLASLVIDVGFADARGIRVGDDATGFVMTDVEVRNAANHCVDIRDTADVLIDESRIHHCLRWDGGRVDAHGISAGAVQRLTVRNTEVHTFTGDALQVDPSRAAPGWDEVLVEGCTFWLEPVPDDDGGVPVGVVPGENAIDTKTDSGSVGRLTLRDTVAFGFRNGEISNMAAFNLKEDVDVTIEAVTVYDSEIAFRIRGREGFGAQPTLTNVLVYDVDTALRLEGELQADIPVHHVTFGSDIDRVVQTAGGASADRLDVRNVVVLGAADAFPGAVEAVAADFQNAAQHDYVPTASASWLDSGEDLGVTRDLRGALRPQGAGPEPGAFERGDALADVGGDAPDLGGRGSTSSDTGASVDDAGSGSRPATPANENDGCACASVAPTRSFSVIVLLFLFGAMRTRRPRQKP